MNGGSHILSDPKRDWELICRRIDGNRRYAYRKLDVDWEKYNTNDYLFTHDTACCSVETEENGYWIKPACWELVNANGNAWTNPVLLGSFRTFVGGDNFLEHCFVRGTGVLMADGTYRPIESLKPGDKVINHLGNEDAVVNVQVRKSSDLYEISSGRSRVVVTGNHPMLASSNGALSWKRVDELDPFSDRLVKIGDSEPTVGFSRTKIDVGEQTVYNIEVEKEHSYVADGIVVHNCQIPALSKGKILDAIIRPVHYHSEKENADADIWYVDLLIATSRKHTSLIERIESGKLSTLSMGCIANVTQCSICGRTIHDGEKNCEHLDKHLGQMVTCSDGKQRMCAELCGCTNENGEYEEGSVTFIEQSWVNTPAFKGSVVNYFVETPEMKLSRESERDDLSRLFEGNLFERLKVADVESSIALRIAREESVVDRISRKISGQG